MFGISFLTGPILGGIALALFLSLAGTALHTWGIPFLGLKGLSGQLSDAEKARDACVSSINDPTTGWAVRFKTSQNNETVFKNELAARSADADKAAAETKARDEAAEHRLAQLRLQNAGLNRQVRAIVTRPQPMSDVAKEAVQIVLGSLTQGALQ